MMRTTTSTTNYCQCIYIILWIVLISKNVSVKKCLSLGGNFLCNSKWLDIRLVQRSFAFGYLTHVIHSNHVISTLTKIVVLLCIIYWILQILRFFKGTICRELLVTFWAFEWFFTLMDRFKMYFQNIFFWAYIVTYWAM